ncbi:MAG: hypothetical protein HOP12_07105 [Candidatus Eisenbacteria bacterium]|uniref:FlgD/Vpr Ig-like domain-containing protein n=1 Tax=Eiseniibacteriota bacterium TaxID=2212470 RepID=A0A849SEX0_UNCEI|nr:hypothetical protein [Candidatus Eisenbacteria bacterium]
MIRTRIAVIALGLAMTSNVTAATLHATVPYVTAAPGATVDVPITVVPGAVGQSIVGIQLRLDLGAAVVQSSSFVNGSGWLWNWGAPAQNANSGFAAAAAAGVAPVTASSFTIATVRVVVRADAVLGTDLPLVLSTLILNEGNPSTTVTNGVLRVRNTAVDAPLSARERFELAAPAPNPARGSTTLAFTLPREVSEAQLEVLSIDGRRVRVLERGRLAAGTHARRWDLLDEYGHEVAAGLYLVRFRADGETRIRRLAVTR